jgi:hypothetical protein
MKRLAAALFSSIFLMSLAPAALADEPPPPEQPAPETEPETVPEDGACKKLIDACKGAGFKKGERKSGKGLHADCMKKLLAGQTVEGVTVDSKDVETCKAQKPPGPQKLVPKPVRKLLK